MRLTIFTLLLAAVASSAALADNAAGRKVFGFSDDGEYFAFEQFVDDTNLSETPNARSTITVLQVPRGDYVFTAEAKSANRKASDDLATVRQRNDQAAQPILSHYKIGAAGMRFAVITPSAPLDSSGAYGRDTPPDFTRTMDITLPDNLKAKITLKELDFNQARCGASQVESRVKGLSIALEVTDQDGKIGLTSSQSEERPSADLRCALGYGIAEVYVHPQSQNIVVLIEVKNGENVRNRPDRTFRAIGFESSSH